MTSTLIFMSYVTSNRNKIFLINEFRHHFNFNIRIRIFIKIFKFSRRVFETNDFFEIFFLFISLFIEINDIVLIFDNHFFFKTFYVMINFFSLTIKILTINFFFQYHFVYESIFFQHDLNSNFFKSRTNFNQSNCLYFRCRFNVKKKRLVYEKLV